MRRRDVIAIAGAAAGWPLAARGQQKATPVIGFLGNAKAKPGANSPTWAAFLQGLSESGFVDGQNLTIEYRGTEFRYDRLPALVADLVDRKVDVIVAPSDPAARAAKNATPTIPIVFIAGADPVKQGLVASLARPGGNATGIAFLIVDLHPKGLELLTELVPQAKVVGVLVNPKTVAAGQELHIETQAPEMARASGVQLDILKASSESEIDAAFAALVQRQIGALLIAGDPFLGSRTEQIVSLAARYSVPVMYDSSGYVAAGGLISYGTNFVAVLRQLAVYTGRVLKGAKPADLPVVQPTTFELIINLKTAKALGLTVPPNLLARADEVIE
jgi:putative ABC transport system substrate-binding protein